MWRTEKVGPGNSSKSRVKVYGPSSFLSQVQGQKFKMYGPWYGIKEPISRMKVQYAKSRIQSPNSLQAMGHIFIAVFHKENRDTRLCGVFLVKS